jgi:hypothetical protein
MPKFSERPNEENQKQQGSDKLPNHETHRLQLLVGGRKKPHYGEHELKQCRDHEQQNNDPADQFQSSHM